MEQALKEKAEAKEEKESIPLLICPSCFKGAPYFSLQLSHDQMLIHIRCSCSKEDQVFELNFYLTSVTKSKPASSQCTVHKEDNVKYCIECSKWLCKECLQLHLESPSQHTIIDSEVKVKCSAHEKDYSSFCRQCFVNLCSNCSSSHTGHKLIALNEVKGQSIDISKLIALDSMMKNNKEVSDKLIERIEKEVSKPSLLKHKLKTAFNENRKVNLDLKLLYQSLCKTALVYGFHPSYQMMKFNETISINQSHFIEEFKGIEKLSTQFENYLRSTFILSQKDSTRDDLISFAGHKECINSLTQLSNGRLASCSNDKSIKIWNLSTLQCEGTLAKHNHRVNCLVQLHNGNLASGSDDNTIILWNISSLEYKGTFSRHKSGVRCLVALSHSPNSNVLASGSDDNTIKLWNIATLECIETIAAHSRCIQCLIELSNGLLASASDDTTIRLWSPQPLQCISCFAGNKYYVASLIQLKQGDLAAILSNGTIVVWKGHTLQCRKIIENYTHCGTLIRQLNNGKMATLSQYNCIKLWNAETFELEQCSDGIIKGIRCFIQLKDGRIACADYENNINLFELI